MVAIVSPGSAFWIPSDRGFALGICTHIDKQHTMGALVWLADRFFEEPPTKEDVSAVGWRWCVFFPLGAAARRKIVEVIGKVEIPEAIQGIPLLRTGGIKGVTPRWTVCRNVMEAVRPATDADMTLNIRQIVNDTRLLEMLASDWKPEDRV